MGCEENQESDLVKRHLWADVWMLHIGTCWQSPGKKKYIISEWGCSPSDTPFTRCQPKHTGEYKIAQKITCFHFLGCKSVVLHCCSTVGSDVLLSATEINVMASNAHHGELALPADTRSTQQQATGGLPGQDRIFPWLLTTQLHCRHKFMDVNPC